MFLLECFAVLFTGADTNRFGEVEHKNFAISDAFGFSGAFDGLHGAFGPMSMRNMTLMVHLHPSQPESPSKPHSGEVQ